MDMLFAQPAAAALPLHAITKDGLPALLDSLDPMHRSWAEATGFSAAAGTLCLLPATDGGVAGALVGLGDDVTARRDRFVLAGIRARLPVATFRLQSALAGAALDEAALGWLLSGYRFSRYSATCPALAGLIAPEGIDASRLEAIAAGEKLTRDLINTPASDMGPDDLEAAILDLARSHGAATRVVRGAELLSGNLPMIHAVGRAAGQAPRLIEMSWGDTGPALTLVGKGVCFDTGGLNIKPGTSMGLMKKDMGGAATVLGLAGMIMSLGIAVRLRVLIPAVENSIAGDAMRPGDILTSRKGLTVEINNTDAEGRLVLADALALADEAAPDLIVSMATLTGAARVAVGPDLAPFYASHEADAAAVTSAAALVRDPVWQMPFWDPYEKLIEPGIADLDNAPKGGFAGSITAALFLRRFVTATPRYMHFDIFGWNPEGAPARPRGGVGQGARALLQALPDLLAV